MPHPRLPERSRRLLAVSVLGLSVLLAGCGASGGDDGADATTITTAASGTDDTSTTTDAQRAETSTTVAGDDAAQRDTTWSTDATEHRGNDGDKVSYDCPAGGEAARVWGVETYTDDSSVCTAAVQVGLIDPTDGGTVEIEIAQAEDTYLSGTANGVTSTSYGGWAGSFTFPEAPPGSLEFDPSTESWSENASASNLEVGDDYRLSCAAGGEPGRVWGTDTYTADSSICTAAVHTGVITAEKGGNVAVEIAEGQGSYEGSVANDITTSDYGSYDKSYTFPKDQPDQ